LLLQADPEMGGLMSDDEVQRAKKLLSQAGHVRLPGLGHSLHMSEAAPVLRALTNFLVSLE
jgi:pimeloyl-ACP methyl ester carboxylesterase